LAGLIGIGSFLGYVFLIVGVLEAVQATGASRDVAEGVFAILLGCLVIWARRDSQRLKYHEYRSEIAMEPTWFAVAMLFASPLVLPWYLADRYRISKGTLPKKEYEGAVPGDLGLTDRD